jgi:PEGA domain-containing protein
VRLRFGIAAVIALSACGAAGCAGSTPSARTRVAVVAVGDAGGSPAVGAIVERLRARDDLALTDGAVLGYLAARAASPAPGDSVELQAEESIRRARQSAAHFDYAGATAHLRRALDLLRPKVTEAAGRAWMAAVHLELGRVLLVHGEREAAQDEIRACLHLDRGCSPDPAFNPPELVALYQDVKKRRLTDTAILRIASDPPSARAELDGTVSGTTAVEWKGLEPGLHYLVVSAFGFVQSIDAVLLAPGSKVERLVPLTPGPPEERARVALHELERLGDKADARWRAEAAKLVRTDLLVFAQDTSGGKVSLFAFDVRGELRWHGGTVARDDRGAARAWLEQLVPEPEPPWFGRWWFWALIAAVVAGSAAGVAWLETRPVQLSLKGGETSRE